MIHSMISDIYLARNRSIMRISAACSCHIGKRRKNNEDNFFFAGRYMASCNNGLGSILEKNFPLKKDRECGYKETLSRTTNARCPKCHKRMEMYVKGKEETFICACGYKEKLSAFQARRAKEGAGVNKRDVQKYMRQQQKEAKEPVNNAFAQALAGLKLE